MSEIKPVYRYKFKEDLQWQYTENKAYAHHLSVVEKLYPAAAYEAQAKRIAELEEHVTKLGSGSRQHLYQAFARRYKEILSLRRENEALRKQVEGIAKGIQKHFELSDSDLAILMSNFENGDSK